VPCLVSSCERAAGATPCARRKHSAPATSFLVLHDGISGDDDEEEAAVVAVGGGAEDDAA
jgi:hypothetical protein